MGYSAFLKPRQETISDPTTDVIKVLDEINVRFSSSKESSGLFLFEGLKGIGPGKCFWRKARRL